jgi:hypothetical protein
MSGSRLGLLDLVLEGVELLLQRKADPASFGTKVGPNLNGADPSFINSVTGSICRAKCSNILQDILITVRYKFLLFNLHYSVKTQDLHRLCK